MGAPQTPSAADKSKGWEKPPENPAKQRAAEWPWCRSFTAGACPTGGAALKAAEASCSNCKEVHKDSLWHRMPARRHVEGGQGFTIDMAQSLADKGGTIGTIGSAMVSVRMRIALQMQARTVDSSSTSQSTAADGAHA